VPTDKEKLSAANLRLITSASADQIRAAAARAQEAGRLTLGASIRVKDEGERHITYSVRGPGGLVEILAFELAWGPEEQGRAVVTNLGTFTTMRQKMFGFIPVGPTKVPALKSFSRYADWMRKELAA
jgi:hypothetical protein